MANIKNFGIQGVGSDVQFGKGGARLQTENGLFKVVTANSNATVTTLARMQVAAPVAGTDAINKDALDAAVATLVSNDESHQLAIDGLLANATAQQTAIDGLRTDLTTETSERMAADVSLAENLASEVTRATLAETALQAAIDGEVTRASGEEAKLALAIAAETTRAEDEEARIEGKLDAAVGRLDQKDVDLQAEIDALEQTVAALGNAFNYVGMLDATTEADLDALPDDGKDIGDYYKVSVGGTFTWNAGADSIFVNAGDGLVKNRLGGWDKIDNTNSEVFGSTNFVKVTGSTDTGFTVDLDQPFKDRILDLEAKTSVDTADLQAQIDDLETELAGQVARIDGVDAAQNAMISAEANARMAADALNAQDIANEVARAMAAEAALSTSLNDEIDRAKAAEAALQADIANTNVRIDDLDTATDERLTALEANVAGSTDALQAEIDRIETAVGLNEDGTKADFTSVHHIAAADTVVAAINKLDAALKAEADDRDAFDAGIQAELDATQAGAGLDTNGEYLASVDAEYIADATSLADADAKLDAALKAVDTAYKAADATLQDNIDAVANDLADEITRSMGEEARIEGKLDAEITRSTDADAALNTRIDDLEANTTGSTDALQAEIDAIEAAVGLGEDGNIKPWDAAVEYVGSATTFKEAVEALDAALYAVEGDLAQEVADRLDADNGLQTQITDEVARAKDAENTLSDRIDDVIADYEGADAALQDNIDAVLSKVNALGNAFNYVGVVAGGADALTATDLSALPEGGKDAGDYYKVSAAGYFTVGGGDAFFANTNDGLVFNTEGGVDIIDNTDASVDGTAGEIAVSGSLDSGFVVALDEAFKTRMSDAEDNIIALQGNAASQQTAIDNEIARAVAAEGALRTDLGLIQEELDATQAGAGLAANGTYVAPSDSNYLADAASLFDADQKLDAAIKALETDLDNLSQDQIVSLDGLTMVKAADTGIEFATNVNGARTGVGSIVAGTATNTAFAIDLSIENEVRFEATGSATDVDLRLVPQGDGQVIVGETGTHGVIQGEDGFSLTVAGGDGADLILKGEKVVIGDSAVEAIHVDGTTLAAAGLAADIDLVLAPKGAGSVDASDAKIVNVAAGVAATDAINKGQLDALAQQVSDNAEAATIGAVRSVVATLTAAGPVTLGSIKGTVTRVKVVVTAAFDGEIVVGDAVVADRLAAAADLDETTLGTYLVEVSNQYAASTAIVAQATGASAGTARVFVEYIAE